MASIPDPSLDVDAALGSRRGFLAGIGAVVGAVLPGAQATAQTSPDRRVFVARAFEMRDRAARNGDQAFGAVIVKDGKIVGEGVSAVITGNDPTAHGEVQAIRDACRRLGTRDLSGAELYSSFRPCPMCEAAAYWANVARIFHGADAMDAGAPRLARC